MHAWASPQAGRRPVLCQSRRVNCSTGVGSTQERLQRMASLAASTMRQAWRQGLQPACVLSSHSQQSPLLLIQSSLDLCLCRGLLRLLSHQRHYPPHCSFGSRLMCTSKRVRAWQHGCCQQITSHATCWGSWRPSGRSACTGSTCAAPRAEGSHATSGPTPCNGSSAPAPGSRATSAPAGCRTGTGRAP